MRVKRQVFLTIFLFLWTTAVWADEFPFTPPKNFQLDPAYIALHHPVTTNHILAQFYFDQGLTFIYAFNHDAAYWSFLRASEVDPNLAMGYWGMALALGSNINMAITPERSKVAYESIHKAIALAKQNQIPENEQAYIEALAQRYSKDFQKDQSPLNEAYSDAMRKLSHQYVDDLDAATLFAESLLTNSPWAQWTLEGKPLPGTMEAVRTLESVLQRDPEHLGANHYYIHAVEASNHPEKALLSANRLRKMLPISGHLLHMPAHIYILVGDYHQAAESNEEAIIADRTYIRRYGVQGIYPVHYLSHNLYFLARAYAMEGRFTEAKRAADELAALYLPHFHRMPELEYYAPSEMFVLLRFHHWKEILETPKPQENMRATTALWHFGRGVAFAGLGDAKNAIQERDRFLKEKEKLPSTSEYGYNHVGKILTIAEYSLAAKIAEAQNDLPKSIEWLQRAISEQDTLRYNEPPDWYFPIRESLGAAYLKLNQPAEAEQIFRMDLKKHPRNGRALFGLKESLKAQSKWADYYWVDQEFEKAWKYSDINLNVNDL